MIFHTKEFVEVDLILRRGGHVNRTDFALHDWICQEYENLSTFYSNYGCSLRQHPDGFFFLVSSGKKLKTRVLPKSYVHLGLFLALKARDPEITKTSGWIAIEQLLQDIQTTVPKETLRKVYAPRAGESLVNKRIGEEIRNGIKLFADLKFIEIRENALKPLEAIGRFAELARYDNEPDEIAKNRLELECGVALQIDDEDEEKSEDDKGRLSDDN